MAGSRISPDFWRERRVLLTGHTGFKGAWTALWLAQMGARVHGLSLAPDTDPNAFDILAVGSDISSQIGDIRDTDVVRRAVAEARPEIVIHMAAQALVRRSYREPVETFASNVMGTVNLLDALRAVDGLQAVLVVTSDKVYENSEDGRAFREIDPLGGTDPYSASKAAAEIVTASMARSFFDDRRIPVATARAGNVIGGGDFSEDRLVPDLWRAATSGRPVALRYPGATRPWQHVLDPVGGYLLYAEKLAGGGCAQLALNFGPATAEALPVSTIAERVMGELGMAEGWVQADGEFQKEKQALSLDASLAGQAIGWVPRLGIEETVRWTADWYRAYNAGADMRAFTLTQVEAYEGSR